VRQHGVKHEQEKKGSHPKEGDQARRDSNPQGHPPDENEKHLLRNVKKKEKNSKSGRVPQPTKGKKEKEGVDDQRRKRS